MSSKPTKLFAQIPVVAALVLCPLPALAQEVGQQESEEAEGQSVVELFIGNTRAETHFGDENALSVGLSYHRLLNPTVSVGVLGEYASDPLDSWVLGVPVIFRVGKGWQFTAMPGVEREHGKSEFLFRTGIGYEFELKGYSLKPEVSADFVDGDVAIVTGLSVGFRF